MEEAHYSVNFKKMAADSARNAAILDTLFKMALSRYSDEEQEDWRVQMNIQFCKNVLEVFEVEESNLPTPAFLVKTKEHLLSLEQKQKSED